MDQRNRTGRSEKRETQTDRIRKFFLRHILSFALLIYMEITCAADGNLPGALLSLGYFALLFLAEWYVGALIRYFREKKKEDEQDS